MKLPTVIDAQGRLLRAPQAATRPQRVDAEMCKDPIRLAEFLSRHQDDVARITQAARSNPEAGNVLFLDRAMGGIRGNVKSVDGFAQAYFNLETNGDAANFFLGQTLVFSATDGATGGATRTGTSGAVTAINASTGRITADVSTIASGSGPSVGDYIFGSGEYGGITLTLEHRLGHIPRVEILNPRTTRLEGMRVSVKSVSATNVVLVSNVAGTIDVRLY